LSISLPELSFEEMIGLSTIYSVSGKLKNDMEYVVNRPFQAPHNATTSTALLGGGRTAKPGLVSLCHHGVLFLDEFPEFDKHSCEVLRQPIEDRNVTITRVNATVNYPCSFMMICAMNPCKCGYYGHPTKPCTCTPQSRRNYLAMVSGPILDRIDIQVEVNALDFSELDTTVAAESSEKIRRRVCRARMFAMSRFDGEKLSDGKPLTCNARMQPKHIRKYCVFDEGGRTVLQMAYEKLGLSARGYDRILKVARTVADFDESELIKKDHIALAVQLRSLDRKYFNN
jgi:magnesium chelatase family protein